MRLRLRFKTGRHAGDTAVFEAPRTVVLGRSSQADVQIHDERISRKHCVIAVEPTGARLRDLGSGNGTYLNGAEVRDAALHDGDVVRVGETELEVDLAAPAERSTEAFPAGAAPVAVTDVLQGPPQFAGAPAPAPSACAACGAPLGRERVVLHKGRYLCVRCAPPVEVPGYRIERLLGEGGMGAVYLAAGAGGQAFAIKVLKCQGDMSREDRARFLREAATAAQVQHPNVVRAFDRGEAGPYLYFVMEYVRGRSLKDWIAQHGQLPLPGVVHVTNQVAAALDFAHAQHIVHRDVKPENVLVQEDGLAKLADFGLAKSMLTSGMSGLTRPGDGLGTLPYMPPEQIENALFADHRSDIYALGATVYHMLAGKPPFMARTPLEFFTQIRTTPPAPLALFRADVPRALAAAVERALAKRPDERYQSAGELARTFEQCVRAAMSGSNF